MNDQSPEHLLEELAELRRQHLLLDKDLTQHSLNPNFDQLELSRLKKRKVRLKDQIEKLRSSLIPDQHA